MTRPSPELSSLLREIAGDYKISTALVDAIIVTESSWCPNAVRFEPKFFTRLKQRKWDELAGYAPRVLGETEYVLRSTSWGLMQVLGETARSVLGVRDMYLTVLLDARLSIELGCKYLSLLAGEADTRDWNDTEIRALLLRYNGGGDSKYPDRVFGYRASIAGAYVNTTV